jgi:hypothetical protein
MSSQSDINSSNTRLAPKPNSLPRKNPGTNTNGATANKTIMEKESKLREELTSKLTDQVDALVDTLEEGGVPKDP